MVTPTPEHTLMTFARSFHGAMDRSARSLQTSRGVEVIASEVKPRDEIYAFLDDTWMSPGEHVVDCRIGTDQAEHTGNQQET